MVLREPLLLVSQAMDAEVGLPISGAVNVFGDRRGVELAVALAVPLLSALPLEPWQIELLVGRDPCRPARRRPRSCSPRSRTLRRGWASRKATYRPQNVRGRGEHATLDDLAAEQAGHFRQCWERCFGIDLARRLRTFSRRANQARPHSIAGARRSAVCRWWRQSGQHAVVLAMAVTTIITVIIVTKFFTASGYASRW